MATWTVEFYETAAGTCPVKEVLGGLPPRDAARITHDLALLEQFGTRLGFPYTSHVRGKLWELRTTGRPAFRALYVADRDQRFVVLHLLTKSSTRLRGADIRLAEQRLADHEARHP